MGFRLLVLRRRYGFGGVELVGEQLVEKLLDGMSLGLWGFLALLTGELPAAIRLAVIVACVLGVAASLGFFLSDLPFLRRRLPPMPKISGPSLLWTAVLDGFDMVMLYLCLQAAGVSVSLHVLLLLFVALNLAVLLPLTPAGFGVVEATVMLVLRPLGVPAETPWRARSCITWRSSDRFCFWGHLRRCVRSLPKRVQPRPQPLLSSTRSSQHRICVQIAKLWQIKAAKSQKRWYMTRHVKDSRHPLRFFFLAAL
ncbi:MAG: lysylphosphatidylglycerol synthase domain-containing protein [Polyangia bacterium]